MDSQDLTLQQDIANCIATMRNGGIILYPTDTIWGIGCDATNAEAVEKIYKLKQRAETKSMLVLVDGPAMLERTVEEVPEVAWELIDSAVRPLTLIYDQARGVAPNLVGADGSLGVRISSERFSQELCRRMRGPIVSTSANISGEKAPACFREIADSIIEGVDYAAHYRRDDTSQPLPSNIIKISAGGVFKILR